MGSRRVKNATDWQDECKALEKKNVRLRKHLQQWQYVYFNLGSKLYTAEEAVTRMEELYLSDPYNNGE